VTAGGAEMDDSTFGVDRMLSFASIGLEEDIMLYLLVITVWRKWVFFWLSCP
jgi:hypothetical protein